MRAAVCISGHWGFSSSPLLDFFFFLKLYCKVDICKHWGPAARGAHTSPVPTLGTACGGCCLGALLEELGAGAPRSRGIAKSSVARLPPRLFPGVGLSCSSCFVARSTQVSSPSTSACIPVSGPISLLRGNFAFSFPTQRRLWSCWSHPLNSSA